MLFLKCENCIYENPTSPSGKCWKSKGNTSKRNTRAHLSGFRYPHDVIDENDVCSSCQVCTRIRERENANALGTWVRTYVQTRRRHGSDVSSTNGPINRTGVALSTREVGDLRMRGRNSKDSVNWSFQPRKFRKSEHVIKRPGNRGA